MTLSRSAQTALLLFTPPTFHLFTISRSRTPCAYKAYRAHSPPCVTANSHRAQLPSSRALFTHRRSQPRLLGIHPIFMQESMTFKSTSTSGTTSSKASSLFDLDENSNKGILVYRVRSGAASLDTTTEAALCAELDQRKCLLHRVRL